MAYITLQCYMRYCNNLNKYKSGLIKDNTHSTCTKSLYHEVIYINQKYINHYDKLPLSSLAQHPALSSYRGADKSSARPGRKQATATENFYFHISYLCRSQWPRDLRRRSSAVRLLKLWVRIPPGAWIFVCCECCVLSGRGLCDGLITRPGERYRMWRVVVCDQEISKTRRLKPATGL